MVCLMICLSSLLLLTVLKPYFSSDLKHVRELRTQVGMGLLVPCDRTIEHSVPAASYTWMLADFVVDAFPQLLPLSDRVIMDLQGE